MRINQRPVSIRTTTYRKRA